MHEGKCAGSWWSSFVQVIQQSRDNAREKNQCAGGESGESPVEPGDADAGCAHSLQEGWPKIAREFLTAEGRQILAELLAELF